jgi:hypothetical protein
MASNLSYKQMLEIIYQAIIYARKNNKLTHLSTDEYKLCLQGIWPKTKCLFSGYAPAKKTGYTQCRYNTIKYYLHRVAALVQYENSINKEPLPENWEGSHWFCHNPICFNPAHLWPEDGNINKSRLCCKLYSKVQDYKCPHNPTCQSCKPLLQQ